MYEYIPEKSRRKDTTIMQENKIIEPVIWTDRDKKFS
jgi:hypothetical protein